MKTRLSALLLFLASGLALGQTAFSQSKADQSVAKNAALAGLTTVQDESVGLANPIYGINFLGSTVTCVRNGSTFMADCTFTGGGGSTPTGTGFVHITGGAQDAASRAVDVSSADITGLLPFANIANGSALSLLGRSANSGGVMASITCSAAGFGVLRESGSVLACGAVDISTAAVTGKLPLANETDGGAISVLGRSANSGGVRADISCTAASGNVVRENGSALGCSALPVTAPVVNTTGTLSLAVTPANPGGAIALQASAPGTVQSTAFSNIDGLSTVTKANILLVRTPAFFASNTTASDAVNTVQFGPSYQTCGSAWNSVSVAAETDCYRLTLKPITAAGTTTMTLGFDFSTNGGAYVTDRFLVAQNGSISSQGNATLIGATGNFTVPSGGNGKFLFSGHGGLNDTGTDGKLDVETSGGTIASYTSGIVTASSLAAGIFQVQAGNGALCQYGSSTEAITLATGAVTTDSTNTLLPANSIIDGFVFRVTASITGATTIQFGDDSPQVARFSGALSATPCGAANIAIGATGMCTQIFDQSNASLALGTANQTARKVRVTANANAGASSTVRVTVFWHVLTPPTS
jgi:hypothetical protein